MTELAQIIAAWPVVLSMAAAVAMQNLRAGRRRSALNEALHELRRPLQAVALAAGPRLGDSGVSAEDPIELAAAALERLDREINGGPLAPALGPVDATALARSAVARWQARVRMAEGSLELRWSAGGTLVSGDRSALAQALDNLIVNAIEHGGPTIVVAGRLREGRLRIAVVDSGRRAWRSPGGPPPPATTTGTASAWCAGWRPIMAVGLRSVTPSAARARFSSCRWPRRRTGRRREPAHPRTCLSHAGPDYRCAGSRHS